MEKPDVDHIRASRPPSRSSRGRRDTTRARPWPRRPRSTTTCACSSRGSASSIATGAAGRSARQSIDEIVARVIRISGGRRRRSSRPSSSGRKGEYRKELEGLARQGFLRVRVDGEIQASRRRSRSRRTRSTRSRWWSTGSRSTRAGGADRRLAGDGARGRQGDGDRGGRGGAGGGLQRGVGLPELRDQLRRPPPAQLLVQQPLRRVPEVPGTRQPARDRSGSGDRGSRISRSPRARWPSSARRRRAGTDRSCKSLAKRYGFSLDAPWKKLPKKARDLLLYGTKGSEIEIAHASERGEFKWRSSFEGVIGNLIRRYRETQSEEMREWIEAFMSPRACPECKGARLKAESLAVRIGKRNISDLTHLSVRDGLALWRTRPGGAGPGDRRTDREGDPRSAPLPLGRRA